ncbi:MAG: glycosyltransferase [Actinobacteria bacterium]|uniref:Unannotated protein n=1 Tax=freshwater metagenome TaxID=449393 RepID=A0A6J6TDH7_9ZZZZ|nr:glycosyltransferase [Actinomycetota bacterium]MSW79161.1 glycosyltransferase [Actinomycetota bacterium]MSX54417.1 glycosyltransferase [Actinomycetota bacterium]MSZ84612.1 glycosyltransferase [Actinomycetota bacterium]MTB19461.1 glycosyltransferase [Actinomycetota bacterium]
MKVLVAHNMYRRAQPSGENNVVEAEVDLLRAAGVEVQTYFRESDEIDALRWPGRLRVAVDTINGAPTRRGFGAAVRDFRPDIVHLHNPYPLITPSVIAQAHAVGAKVVATVHNYRLECLSGNFYRDGDVCTDCHGHSLRLPGVRHGCYRASTAQSLVMAAALRRHDNAWDGVHTFIAVSEFVAERLRLAGISAERIQVKPNATPDTGPATPPGHGLLFAGRFTDDKGIGLLLDAWTHSELDGDVPLVVVGDGPQVAAIGRRARSMRSVECLGTVASHQVAELRQRTAACVMPSLWWETHSSAPESFAVGRAVIATRNGALAHVVDDEVGWTVEATVESLATALRSATDLHEATRRGTAARARYDLLYRPNVVRDRLLAIYNSVLG